MLVETDRMERINSLITFKIKNKLYTIQVWEACCGASEGDHFVLNDGLTSTEEEIVQASADSDWAGYQENKLVENNITESTNEDRQGSSIGGENVDHGKEEQPREVIEISPTEWEQANRGGKKSSDTRIDKVSFPTPKGSKCKDIEREGLATSEMSRSEDGRSDKLQGMDEGDAEARPRQESNKKKAMRFVRRMNEGEDNEVVNPDEERALGEEDALSAEELWEKKTAEGCERIIKRKQAKNKKKGRRKDRRRKDHGGHKVKETCDDGDLRL